MYQFFFRRFEFDQFFGRTDFKQWAGIPGGFCKQHSSLETNTRIFNSGISRDLRWAGSAYALRSWGFCRITLVPVLAAAAVTDCARACVLQFVAVLLPIHIMWLESTNVKTLTVRHCIECSVNAQK